MFTWRSKKLSESTIEMTSDQAELVLNWYVELERRLCAILRTVPFNPATAKITLPPLANIVVDAGSLVDTIFREEFSVTSKPRDKLTIRDFAPHYESCFRRNGNGRARGLLGARTHLRFARQYLIGFECTPIE